VPCALAESGLEDYCKGCQPCTEPHCRICGIAHADGTCAECLAEVRGNLREIATRCDALPAEVAHRGVEGEAMMLLGPAADWEALNHMEASVKAGRVPPEYLEHANDERHPVFVLNGWDAVWRDALDHADPDKADLATFVDYLDRTMAYMAGFPFVPFEDFARDVRGCLGHLDAVLHDGEQHDRGAPCMSCGRALERVWGDDQKADGWMCPRCKRTSTEAQYRFAVAHLHREEAEWLTDREMQIRTGVRAGTVRVWATRGYVGRRQNGGRTEYRVADVETHAAS
jgi:hypothetical protein